MDISGTKRCLNIVNSIFLLIQTTCSCFKNNGLDRKDAIHYHSALSNFSRSTERERENKLCDVK